MGWGAGRPPQAPPRPRGRWKAAARARGGRRARAGAASAARGEKFPTPELEAEKFRPRRAAPKPGQHCPRVGAARRCSGRETGLGRN